MFVTLRCATVNCLSSLSFAERTESNCTSRVNFFLSLIYGVAVIEVSGFMA